MSSELLERYARLFRHPWMRVFAVIYLAFIIATFVYTFMRQRSRHEEPPPRATLVIPIETLQAKVDALDRKLQKMEERAAPTSEEITALRTQLASIDPSKLQALLATTEKYGDFSKQVQTVQDDLLNLRRILNPSDPSTLLAIPRLQDKFDDLVRQLAGLKSDVAATRSDALAESTRMEARLKSEVDRIVDMIKWLLLLLIPLAFATFRDLFGKKRGTEESQTNVA